MKISGFAAFTLIVSVFSMSIPALGTQEFDVVVYGGTPGGVAAAITAARLGRTVALVENHKHLGGMTTSGLGKTDVETRAAIRGLFAEFTGRVYNHYVSVYGADSENVKRCRDGYYYEPSVAQKIIDEMVAEETRIQVLLNFRLDEVVRSASHVTAIRIANRSDGRIEEFRGRIFVDATYEGDLAAFAGARYRLGREGRSEFDELHAGTVYQDYRSGSFLAGTSGEGDHRLPAYTYRLCLTSDPDNSAPIIDPPPDYDRSHYLGYVEDWKAGRMAPPKEHRDGVGYYNPIFNTVVRALSLAEIPNGKFDVNMNPRPLGFPFAEENDGYPEGDWEERERIAAKIRNLTIGLLHFLQNDEAVPPEQRKLARQYNFAKDEFVDNGNFPWQLYIREARRIVGLYTLTENDTIVGPDLGRTRIQADSIAAGEFPIDSFPVRKHQPGHDVVLEGYIFMLENMTRPYQIPYGIMVPERVDGLLVPVAASTTHIAFSTIRLEPTWMALGQAAGAAAHLAIAGDTQPRFVEVEHLQRELLRSGQVITYFKDIDPTDPSYAAIQYFGTKGFFQDYYARSTEPVDGATARDWWHKAIGVFPKDESGEGDSSHLTKGQLASWLRPGQDDAKERDATAVSRGEFCRILYEWEDRKTIARWEEEIAKFVRGEIPTNEGHISFLKRSGHGPALILLPGTFSDSLNWAEVVADLDPDLTLVLVEMRGQGESWPPPQDGSIRQFAEDVLGVADALELETFYVGGHSLGGMVALEVGRLNPERIKGICSVEGWTHYRAAVEGFNDVISNTLTPELLAKKNLLKAHATGKWTEEQKDAMAKIWRQWEDGMDFLETTSIPVLELYGDRGMPRPSQEALWIPRRDNIRFQWIENASHSLPLERPREVAEAIMGFIRDTESIHN